jgi:DnaJ domain
MKAFLLFVVLASVIQFYFGLDNSLIEKDLYKDLGLKVDASLHDIKRAFRKLAQVHHPDKSLPSDKEANAVIFREIAAAYEVLSDSAQRQEYDSIRSMQQRRNQQQPHYGSSQRGGERGRRNQRYQYENDEIFEDDDETNFSGYRPVIAGSILPAMQVIYPYTPILVSLDRSHFALLDMHCSLGVYRGDIDILIRYLLIADRPPDLTMMPLELKFRTEGDSSLNGQCFAGLDDSGVLRVYRGHPDYSEHSQPLWSSGPPREDISNYNSYFHRFYVELLSSGELAVRMLEYGSSESQCVWSTTSCNVYVALLKDMTGQVAATVNEIRGEIKEFLKWLTNKAAVVRTHLMSKKEIFAFLKLGKEKIINQTTKLWNSSPLKDKKSFDEFTNWNNFPGYKDWNDMWNEVSKKTPLEKKKNSTEKSAKKNDSNLKNETEESGAQKRNKRRRASNS